MGFMNRTNRMLAAKVSAILLLAALEGRAVVADDCYQSEKKAAPCCQPQPCCQPAPCCGQTNQKPAFAGAATCPAYEYMNWGSYSSYYALFYPDIANCQESYPSSIDGSGLTLEDCDPNWDPSLGPPPCIPAAKDKTSGLPFFRQSAHCPALTQANVDKPLTAAEIGRLPPGPHLLEREVLTEEVARIQNSIGKDIFVRICAIKIKKKKNSPADKLPPVTFLFAGQEVTEAYATQHQLPIVPVPRNRVIVADGCDTAGVILRGGASYRIVTMTSIR